MGNDGDDMDGSDEEDGMVMKKKKKTSNSKRIQEQQMRQAQRDEMAPALIHRSQLASSATVLVATKVMVGTIREIKALTRLMLTLVS